MAATPWHNRIVGTGEESPDQLLANPKNYRGHPDFQKQAVSGSLDELGWIRRVLVNKRTGFVIDGHLRVAIAAKRGEMVPVEYVDLSDAEEALALAVLDHTASLAFTDTALLKDLLDEVTTGDAALQQMLSKMAEEQGIIPPDFNPADEWVGMPEFEQEDQMPVKQVIVSFHTPEDVEKFARLIGQTVNMQTKGITFPPTRATFHTSAYTEASDAA